MIRYRPMMSAAAMKETERVGTHRGGPMVPNLVEEMEIVRDAEGESDTPMSLPSLNSLEEGEVARPSIFVAMYGAAGRVCQVLARLLWQHPQVTLASVASQEFHGRLYATPMKGAPTLPVLRPTELPLEELSLVFLCASDPGADILVARCVAEDTRVIDLCHHLKPDITDTGPGADFDIGIGIEEDVAYGLTELFRDELGDAQVVFTPGGYSTCAGLALGPLAQAGQLNSHTIIQNSTSAHMQPQAGGPDTCGEIPTPSQHKGHLSQVAEARQALEAIGGEDSKLVYAPQTPTDGQGLRLACLTRVEEMTPDEVRELYLTQYAPDHFVQVLPKGQKAQAADVINTNVAAISIHPFREQREVMILSAIDTLYKGAAGQAVQNMNAMLGFAESCGLKAAV